MATLMQSLPLSPFLFLFIFDFSSAQITVGDSIFDSLDKLKCNQFKKIILTAGLEQRYSGVVPATIFVFTDETYNMLPPSQKNNLYETDNALTSKGPRDYVQSFTLYDNIETDDFTDGKVFKSEKNDRGYLFLNKRKLRVGNTASGTPGATRFFVNGAMVVKANLKAGFHTIHIIDRVLRQPLPGNAISYAADENPERKQFKFFTDLMEPLSRIQATDSEDNYVIQVKLPLQSDQVTFFLPTDAAMAEIPRQKLAELVGNPTKLLEIITLHIVPKKALYTSLVNHNEQFASQRNSGNVRFRKNFNKEAVFITGARRGGDTVTAQISPANVTVHNGVVHHIDQVLGFVYKTAIEEISTDVNTNNFQRFIDQSRRDLQAYISASSGVTVFVPTNNAIRALSNVYPNYVNNQSLINRVVQLSLLAPGVPFSLTEYNRGYNSMILKESRYNARLVRIYSEGNDTWVEGGYVRARVIKPDIGVTNGFVHIIDAVFGIPTRDIVYTIFCNDWLTRTYEKMAYVGLDKYMRDSSLVSNQQCSFASGQSGSSAGEPNDVSRYSKELCGDGYYRCEFTFFVPNGTAIDQFTRMPQGQTILNDQRRFRWILRRLITRRRKIYLDQLALGASHYYRADNGEEVYIRIDGRNSLPSGQRVAYLIFENVRAEIIRSDIGASNGVIHIIDNILFVQDDLTRDVSLAVNNRASTVVLAALMILLYSLLKT